MAVSDDLSDSFKSLDKRIKALENSIKPRSSSDSDIIKKPKKPSEYNIFMKKYISDEKEKGTKKPHSEVFSAGAKAWSQQKK